MTEGEDDKCSQCRRNPVHIGSMCRECWDKAQEAARRKQKEG